MLQMGILKAIFAAEKVSCLTAVYEAAVYGQGLGPFKTWLISPAAPTNSK
jgi:hypothetical protein